MLFALYFLFTQIILYPSEFSAGAKDSIIVVMHVNKFKKKELKMYKVYKAKRHRKII